MFLRSYFSLIFVSICIVSTHVTFANDNEDNPYDQFVDLSVPDLNCANGHTEVKSDGTPFCVCELSYSGDFCTDRAPCNNGQYENNV